MPKMHRYTVQDLRNFALNRVRRESIDAVAALGSPCILGQADTIQAQVTGSRIDAPISGEKGWIVMLPWPPKILSPNARAHWAAKAKAAKAYRAECARLTKAAGLHVDWDGTIHLWITFLAPDRRHRDDDNLIAAFKSGRDGMADALGVDDKRFRIHPWLSDEITKGGAVKMRLSQGITE